MVPSYHKTLAVYVFEASALGLLSAISARDMDEPKPLPCVVDLSSLSLGEKRQLRTFLMQEKWFKGRWPGSLDLKIYSLCGDR